MNLLSSTRYAVAVFSFAGLLAPPLLSVVHGAESSSSRGYPGFGPGIAAAHPGDIGLAEDPRVIFVEDFEEAGTAAMAKRWEAVADVASMSFTNDIPRGTALYRRLANKAGGFGYDRVFARYYEKPAGHRVRVQFDDVVVATDYIGPIVPKK